MGFESTVSRRFVHRRAVAEVFLTDCVASNTPDNFTLGAQWPRLHSYYRSHTGRYDTMLLVETLRQATIYLAHTRYRVPLGHPFVMHTLRVDTTAHTPTIGDRPAEVTIDAHVGDQIYRGNTLARFSVTYVCSIDGIEIGRGVGTASVFTPPPRTPNFAGAVRDPPPDRYAGVPPRRSPPNTSGSRVPRMWSWEGGSTPRTGGHSGSTTRTRSCSTTPATTFPACWFSKHSDRAHALLSPSRAATSRPSRSPTIASPRTTQMPRSPSRQNRIPPCAVRISVEQWGGQHIASGRVRLLPARIRQ